MCNFRSMTKQTIFMKIKTTTKLDSEDRKKHIRSCQTKLYKKKKTGTENPLPNLRKHKIDSFWKFSSNIYIFFFFFFLTLLIGGVCVYNH